MGAPRIRSAQEGFEFRRCRQFDLNATIDNSNGKRENVRAVATRAGSGL
jgi:hypothetical protein